MRHLAVLLPLLLCACDVSRLDLPALPALDLDALPLPKSVRGKSVAIAIAGSSLELDPTRADALSALGTCVDRVTSCYAPPERSLEACVEAVPDCRTARPWEEDEACCPGACRKAFAQRRKAGADEFGAFDAVYLSEPDCFPGVAAALEGR